ncbi:MAG TPA: phospho-N-acetylmuramoyl-pentapeptide-transferase [Candidatus Peribacteraceae bacterium]|nr:phospho-N-acetylmuramoyl-pentapeptide-transferase [Candidatus Peribacteraceae bacterium]
MQPLVATSVHPDVTLLGILGYALFAFALVLALTPWYVSFLRKNQIGKQLRVETVDGKEAEIFRTYHQSKFGTPTMGGVLIWGGIFLTVFGSRILAFLGVISNSILQRGQVYLPLFVLFTLGILGAVDDYLNIVSTDEKRMQRAMSRLKKTVLAGAVIIVPVSLYLLVDYLRTPPNGETVSLNAGLIGVVIWYALFLLIMIFFSISGLVLDNVLQKVLLGQKRKGGLGVMPKLLSLLILSFIGALWFYYKLGINGIHIPYVGDVFLGLWYIPIFMFIVVGTANAVNITDGLDGLAGGLLVIAFGAFGILAYLHGLYLLSAFCGVCVGAIAAFLWHNVPPALFFMGDTGSLALGGTLAVIAMMTDQALILPLIGFVFVVETLSVIMQLLSKKFRNGKKIFKAAPIHHHFEALGWGESKVTMRLWIVGSFAALLGIIIGLAQ